jgi:hypothetical protein
VLKKINPQSGGEFTESMLNRVQELEQYAYTSKFKVLGDPQLEARQIIKVNGVAKIYSGKHYVNRCKHIVSFSGYITEGETIMQSPTVAKFYANLKADTKGKKEVETGITNYGEYQSLMDGSNGQVLANEQLLSQNFRLNKFNQDFAEGLIVGRGPTERTQRLSALLKEGAFERDINSNIDEVFYAELKKIIETATKEEEEYLKFLGESSLRKLGKNNKDFEETLPNYFNIDRGVRVQKRYPKVDGSKPIKK